MDKFEVLRIFIRVVDSGSFSKAASMIGVGQPAISKQIAALEARLGVHLLNRTSRGLSVTAAGQDYYESAIRLLDQFQEAEARVIRQQLAPAGMVRVTVPPAFARLYIFPRLAEFRRLLPHVTLDIMVSERHENLMEEGIDVAVRMGRLSDSTLAARRIGTMRMVTVASASYIHAHGAPATPADLADHDCVVYLFQGTPKAWNFTGPAGPVELEPKAVLRTNDAEHLRAAAIGGIGIGHNPGWLYRNELASGQLVSLLGDYAPPPFPIHAVHVAGRRMPARVRCFIDFLADLCSQEPELKI